MSETPERRIARRIEIRLPIVYRGPDGVAVPGTTKNVSRRGMLLVVTRSTTPGTTIDIAITGIDGRERKVTGDVVRTAGDGSIGVAFPESVASVLEEVIDQQSP
jgi:hypothetical protein